MTNLRNMIWLVVAGCSVNPGAAEQTDRAPVTGPSCPAPVVLGTAGDCNPQTGFSGPKRECSPSAPCTTGLGTTITTEINAPDASSCNGDQLRQWIDANGDARWACTYVPTGAGEHPLLVYLPPSLTSVSSLYQVTNLRQRATTFDLSNGVDGPGFAIAALQERNEHDEGTTDGDGQHWDSYFRDLRTDSCNPDVRTVDTLIDTLVAGGGIDRDRIYVIGWSDGAFFAQMYGIARHEQSTPHGNHVAGVVAYSGADPFAAIPGSSNDCQLAHYPTTTTPILGVHRSCDLVACDVAQDFGSTGLSVERWFAALALRDNDHFGTDVILDATGHQVQACELTPPCNRVSAVANHIRWPDGDHHDDIDWEPTMLAFLAAHPMP